jgi:hypothetical protein
MHGTSGLSTRDAGCRGRRCEQRVDGFGEAKKAKLLDLDLRVCGWLAVCIFQFMRVSKGAISNTGLM